MASPFLLSFGLFGRGEGMSKKNKRTNRDFHYVVLGIGGFIFGIMSVLVGLEKGNWPVVMLGIALISLSLFSVYGGLFLWD